MEKLSRTKKYAELREKIQNDREQIIETNELSSFQNKLNNISSDHFEKAEVKEDLNHDPIHARREENYQEQDNDENQNVSTFNNDYLDEYINEVKEYNKKKGLLTDEDTQSNILNEIRSPKSSIIRPFGDIDLNDTSSLKPFKNIHADDYIHEENNNTIEIPFISAEEKNNTISLEIKNLLKSEDLLADQKDDETPLDTKVYNELKSATVKDDEEHLLNETVQMVIEPELKENTPMIEKDKEPTEVDDEDEDDYGEGSNRIINFVLIVLILVFLVVLGLVGYWILLQKGII